MITSNISTTSLGKQLVHTVGRQYVSCMLSHQPEGIARKALISRIAREFMNVLYPTKINTSVMLRHWGPHYSEHCAACYHTPREQ